MAGVTHRDEYFIDNGNLVRRTGRRPTGRGRWLSERDPMLAVAVEMCADGIQRVFRGRRHTDELEREAVARSYGLRLNDQSPNLGQRVPPKVVQQLRARVQSISDHVASRYRSLTNEERTTGALFSELPELLEVASWEIRFHSQGYTSVQKNAKETRTGADAGIVVEIRVGEESVAKALWLQAKRAESFSGPREALKLPRLADQMRTMNSHTSDGYAVIYTPHGVTVTDGKDSWAFADWLSSAVQCERGDRDPTAIVNTLDSDYLLEMTVSSLQ